MTVYLIHHEEEGSALLDALLADEFDDFVQATDTTWFVATEMDLDQLDELFEDRLDDTKRLIVIELTGDFTMQGLPDDQMVWLDAHLSS